VEYRTLGTTGVQVSSLALGTMVMGEWGNTDHDECVAMIHTALDAGINLVDTADMYAAGETEEIVGRALRGRRDDVVLATKFWNPMGDDINQRGASRRWIMQAVEASLRRLETDWIDLYQIHRPDQFTAMDEIVDALGDLVRQGKVRYLGTSTWPAELLVEAQWSAARRNTARFVCEQPPYSIFTRGIETAVLPTARRHGMGVIVWAPLNGGWLTGKYQRRQPAPEGSRGSVKADHFPVINDEKWDALEALGGVAADIGVSLTHLALAWVRAHPAITAAIIGPKRPEQLADLLAGAELTLDDATLDRIDAIVAPGTNLGDADAGWTTWELEAVNRRR
jgi:aryl-alcohol dehydrogenase-like predicted oxidoreductase